MSCVYFNLRVLPILKTCFSRRFYCISTEIFVTRPNYTNRTHGHGYVYCVSSGTAENLFILHIWRKHHLHRSARWPHLTTGQNVRPRTCLSALYKKLSPATSHEHLNLDFMQLFITELMLKCFNKIIYKLFIRVILITTCKLLSNSLTCK